MDKLRSIKIKNLDGTYTEEIPVGVLIENVDYNEEKTLKQILDLDITKGTVEERLNNWENSKALVIIYTEEADPDSYETISFTCNYSFGDIQIAIREGRPIIGYYDYKVGNDHVTTSLDGFSYSDEIGSIEWRSTKPRITNLDYVAISNLKIVHNLNGNIEHSAESKKVPLVSE